jgi:hypothetical protein
MLWVIVSVNIMDICLGGLGEQARHTFLRIDLRELTRNFVGRLRPTRAAESEFLFCMTGVLIAKHEHRLLERAKRKQNYTKAYWNN